MGADASKGMTVDEGGPATKQEEGFMDRMRDSVAGGVNAIRPGTMQTTQDQEEEKAGMCGLDKKMLYTVALIILCVGLFFLVLSFLMMYIFTQLAWYDSMWLAIVVMTIGNICLLVSTFFLNFKAQFKVCISCGLGEPGVEMSATCSPWRQIALGVFLSLMVLTLVLGIGSQFMDSKVQAVLPLFIGCMAVIQVVSFAVYIVLIVKPLRQMIGGACKGLRAASAVV